METQYKIIITNSNLYKEIELTSLMSKLKIGTGTECDVRLRPDLFFDSISLELIKSAEGWNVICSDNVYISLGDIRKLFTKYLQHGDEFEIRYQNGDTCAFHMFFSIDFDYVEKEYDVCVDIADKKYLKIGGISSADIELKSEYVKDDFFEVKKQESDFVLLKDTSRYGVYLNGKKIERSEVLHKNDFISLADFKFCFDDGKLYVAGNENIRFNNLQTVYAGNSKSQHIYPKFNRSTRVRNILNTEKITVLDPPAAPQKPKSNIVMQLMPAIAMLAVTIILRGFVMNSGGSMSGYIWISAISMGIGILTSIFGIVDERKQYKKDIAERIENYTTYITDKEKQIGDFRAKEAEQLNNTYYSVEKELNLVEDFLPELFDRIYSDSDFLNIRVGTGTVKSVRVIDYKKQEKFGGGDKLTEIPHQISEKYKYIDNLPVTLCLKEQNAIGFVGKRNNLYGMLKNITVDLVTRQYYTDLSLFYIISENEKEQFSWIRFLPHIQNDVLQMRNIVCDDNSKNYLFEYLYKELSRRENEKENFPEIVVFVYDDMGIKRYPISQFLDYSAKMGVHFIFFEEYLEMLPNGCTNVIKVDEHEGELLDVSGKEKNQKFVYDEISDKDVEKMVNKLAPVYCEEVSLEGALTKNITLYEMINILNVGDIDLEKNWASSEVYKSMAAPLGVKTKNEIVYLDLNEKKHGPHGLVAGTTGSGKSEILQTYILSMATLFHPYEVGFVIIDFKGGGMVNQFKNLPHLIGAITNIDGREINRSLLSIKAELRKRQALFAKYGVNHIDQYIKLFKKGETDIPLPHLILIVDEFAELKMDQPEFMKELISAARIGRSLGVHLILATQKPSGVVDAQIWSNSKFKLCLKVQNKEDSNEVLKTPLAAEIKEPGRAYLQVGNNEIFELFQSAYSGASIDIGDSKGKLSFSIDELNLSGKRKRIYTRKSEKNAEESDTQLNAIVNYIENYCEKNGIMKLPGICLPPLTENVDYVEVGMTHDAVNTIIPLGIYDDPDNQVQDEVRLNLLDGNTLIVGSSQYGKTNLLQVIIRGLCEQYSPSEVNLYVLDFASMALKVFEEINHVGGVVIASEDEKLKNFMRMIRLEMKTRKEIFSKMGITSFASYKEAGMQDIPHIIIMVDNFIALKELYSEYEDEILNICREGVSVGISLVITSLQTNGISYKYMSNFANRICLYCNLGDEYGTLFDRCRMEPKNVPGRGLIAIDKVVYEYQTYLAFDGQKEIDRVKTIKEFIEKINNNFKEQQARKIPEVPQVLNLEYVKNNLKTAELKELQVPVGIDYDTVDFVAIDLEKTLTIGITGREGYGKTNLTKLFIEHLQERVFDVPSKVYILDDYEKQYEDVSAYGIVENYSIDIADFEIMLNEIEEELQMRLQIVRSDGLNALNNSPQIVFVIQNNAIYAPDGIGKSVVETFKRIIKTYKNMKICFIFANVDNVNIAYGSTEMLKMVKDYNYLFVMDDLTNLKLMDINAATIRKYKKMIELGDGYMITEKGVQKQKFIHLEEV